MEAEDPGERVAAAARNASNTRVAARLATTSVLLRGVRVPVITVGVRVQCVVSPSPRLSSWTNPNRVRRHRRRRGELFHNSI